MKQLFNFIPQDAYPIIFEYAKIIIPSFLTYLVTRYSLAKPRKYEIKQKQFDLVYLPLYLLAQQYLLKENNKANTDVTTFIKKVDKLIYRNYPYVYPKTLRLFKELKLEVSKPQINTYFIMNLYYQIETDYNTLKRELGYPCGSIFRFIKQANLMERVLFLINLLLIILFIYSSANSLLELFQNQLADAFFSLFSSAMCALMLYVFHYMKKH